MDLLQQLEAYAKEGLIPRQTTENLIRFIPEYLQAASGNPDCGLERGKEILQTFLNLVLQQCRNPYHFSLYHRAVSDPFDYITFAKEFIRPLIVSENSSSLGLEHVKEMKELLSKGENVILFANHQIEPDPQVITLLLEKTDPNFGEQIIFVAGHRVTTDPLAVPFSIGTDLLCIFSKRHIDTPPEKKLEKLAHNKSVINKIRELLDQGGKCIYVASSGGRDRPNKEGHFEVAPFDPQSIEIFRLIGEKSVNTTHFFPLALYTFPIMPPPVHIQKELHERRQTNRSQVHLAFGEEIQMKNFPGSDTPDKHERRQKLAQHVWEQVNHMYQKLTMMELK